MKTLIATVFFSMLVLLLAHWHQPYQHEKAGATIYFNHIDGQYPGILTAGEVCDNPVLNSAARLTDFQRSAGRVQPGPGFKKCHGASWMIPCTFTADPGNVVPAGAPLLCMRTTGKQFHAKINHQPAHGYTETATELYETEDVRIMSGVIRIDLTN